MFVPSVHNMYFVLCWVFGDSAEPNSKCDKVLATKFSFALKETLEGSVIWNCVKIKINMKSRAHHIVAMALMKTPNNCPVRDLPCK